ncbi:hypothetical protein [Pseudomonas indica]|uniref:hypothetical protein n=1 Tax=Pseudomonas indica TaxID=137658 RepID=UPI000BAB2C82|nr:hypothetical protein [Pseudomonas indica]PAU60869.1 hypothetical protein BZL42_09870 [Pseudomonas indica]
MIKNDPSFHFSSVDAIKHTSVDLHSLARHGKLTVDGTTYRVQVSPSGEFKVHRDNRPTVSPGRFFKAAGEMFSHRLSEGTLSSRSERIAAALNNKAWGPGPSAPMPAPAGPRRAGGRADNRIHPEPQPTAAPAQGKILRAGILSQIERLPPTDWKKPIEAMERLDARSRTLPQAHADQLLGKLHDIMQTRDANRRNQLLDRFMASLDAPAAKPRPQTSSPMARPGGRPHPLQNTPAHTAPKPAPRPSTPPQLTIDDFIRFEHDRADQFHEYFDRDRAQNEFDEYQKRQSQGPEEIPASRPQRRPQTIRQQPAEAQVPRRDLNEFMRDEEARADYHNETPYSGNAHWAYDTQPGSLERERPQRPAATRPTVSATRQEPSQPKLTFDDFMKEEEDRAAYHGETASVSNARDAFRKYQREGNG